MRKHLHFRSVGYPFPTFFVFHAQWLWTGFLAIENSMQRTDIVSVPEETCVEISVFCLWMGTSKFNTILISNGVVQECLSR